MERCCEKCGKTYSRTDNLRRHEKACIEKVGHQCVCGKKFARNDNLKRHKKSCETVKKNQHGGVEESPRKKVKLSEPTEKEEEARREPQQEPKASEQEARREPKASEQEAGPSGYFGEDVGPSNDDDDQVLLQALEEVENHLKQDEEEKIQFELKPSTDRRCKKFGVCRKVFSLRLAENENGELQGQEAWKLLEDALQKAIAKVTSSHKDENALFVAMSSNRLHHTYHSPRLTVGDWRDSTLPARRVWDMMSAILNSNESFRLDDSFHTEITVVETPARGSGRVSLKNKSLESLIRRKKSVVCINNNDELCAARALVTCKAKVDSNANYNTIKRGTLIQTNLAQQLHQVANVPEGPCGLEEIEKFQEHLKDYQIVVISADHGFQTIFRGPSASKTLGLLKTGEHFHALTSLKGFFGRNEYCLKCGKSYKTGGNKRKHNCQGTLCQACMQHHCPNAASGQQLGCNDCGRSFKGPVCLEAHRQKTPKGKPSVCMTYKKCQSCKKQVSGKEVNHHKCWHGSCPSCKDYVDLKTHQCFIQPIGMKEEEEREEENSVGEEEEEEEEEPPLFVYFDVEARQDTGNHVANLLVAEMDQNDQQHSFRGESCIEDFVKWLQDIQEMSGRKLIVVAHNFKGYDSYFLLEEYYRQMILPKQLVNGCKILFMSVGNIHFKDSLCFLPMALAAFSETFGLTELKKGFFPHFFNRSENQDYVGPLPDIHYYDPDGMSVERREEFDKWYKQRKEENFDFQKELTEYCQSDVRLLKEGCEQFRKIFFHQAGFDPLQQCVTIASACNRYYRACCMPPNTIASEPVLGWRQQPKPSSKVAQEWLLCEEEKLRRAHPPSDPTAPPRIAHAGNQGEATILVDGGQRRLFADGYDATTRTVYEFNGCLWHGCRNCFPNRGQKHAKLGGRTPEEVLEVTEERNKWIKHAGYNLKVMWECEWTKEKKTDPEIQEFVKELKIQDPLNPREAFFGGRTNAVKLYHKAQPDEQIWYVDVTSLYPWVNKTQMYPIGHPVFITHPGHTDISQYFGFIKCEVLPPPHLYHPVLPHRHAGKLTFPLCRTCVQNEQVKPLTQRSKMCSHTPEQRKLIGTWPTPELEKAVEKGYKVLYIQEIWNFKERSDQLFRSYVDTWLKIKMEASGWPDSVGEDEEKRRQYVEDVYEREGIRLDPEKIEYNPGLRALAKLMLNSFWGKFGQGSNKSQVQAMTEPSEFFTLVCDDSVQVQTIRIVNEEMVEVVSKKTEEESTVNPNINVFIAGFTTAYARLKLYEALELLGERVLYFDTDSVIYTWKPGQSHVPLGNYLGDYTNEIKADKVTKQPDWIVEFVAAGPKNYGYRTHLGKQECKVRGFTLNTRGSQVINFDSMKDLILAEIEEPEPKPRVIPVVNPHKIKRLATTKTIQTVEETKKYRVVTDKRVLEPKTFMTYPYGYQQV